VNPARAHTPLLWAGFAEQEAAGRNDVPARNRRPPNTALGEEPDASELMRPFPSDQMRMWPISIRVNKPENDDSSIIEPIELATDAA
jgi:hypothetical protein